MGAPRYSIISAFGKRVTIVAHWTASMLIPSGARPRDESELVMVPRRRRHQRGFATAAVDAAIGDNRDRAASSVVSFSTPYWLGGDEISAESVARRRRFESSKQLSRCRHRVR
jgi:hypothetical protein